MHSSRAAAAIAAGWPMKSIGGLIYVCVLQIFVYSAAGVYTYFDTTVFFLPVHNQSIRSQGNHLCDQSRYLFGYHMSHMSSNRDNIGSNCSCYVVFENNSYF
jgi:hypothetical protein